tara:strand:- start:1084 stop:2400 length:1317 start_codon:yes stop_codon:yes gene_type:complete
MAITITSQPTANTFWSSEYPCVVKATSNNASIKYLKFQLQDDTGTNLTDVPAYYAPQISSEFTFNLSDYINGFLSIIKDGFCSFDASVTPHYYDHLLKKIQVEITEIETDGTTDATTDTNAFYMTKAKHQVYNGTGTAQEAIANRYYLTNLPYFRGSTASGNDVDFKLQDGRFTRNYLTDYSRVVFFNAGFTYLTVKAYGLDNVLVGTVILNVNPLGGLVTANKLVALPVNFDDLQTLSVASSESGWDIGGATFNANAAYIEAVLTNSTNSNDAKMTFYRPEKYNVRCPTTFIYMNRFGVHDVLTLDTKTNEAVVSSRDNATLVNTDAFGAFTDDLGAYLLTGARQRAINPKSEFEFQVNNTLPFTPEQNKEIMLDFFASPVHYVVETEPNFASSFEVVHPDTGYDNIRRISINDGKVDVIKNNRAQKLSFSYRYADV